jgi:hypothetical protein
VDPPRGTRDAAVRIPHPRFPRCALVVDIGRHRDASVKDALHEDDDDADADATGEASSSSRSAAQAEINRRGLTSFFGDFIVLCIATSVR